LNHFAKSSGQKDFCKYVLVWTR